MSLLLYPLICSLFCASLIQIHQVNFFRLFIYLELLCFPFYCVCHIMSRYVFDIVIFVILLFMLCHVNLFSSLSIATLLPWFSVYSLGSLKFGIHCSNFCSRCSLFLHKHQFDIAKFCGYFLSGVSILWCHNTPSYLGLSFHAVRWINFPYPGKLLTLVTNCSLLLELQILRDHCDLACWN